MNRSVFNALKVAGLVLVAMWLTSQLAFDMSERTYSKHEQRVLEFAQRKEILADSLQAAADSVAKQRDSLAIVAHEKQKTIIKRIETVREVSKPDPARDSIIDDQQNAITDLNRALRFGQQAEADLRRASNAWKARGDSLEALVRTPRKRPSRLSVGVYAGPCVSEIGVSRVCAGVGVGWKLF
jgi:hypothetical protein